MANVHRIRQMKTIAPDFAGSRRVVGESALRRYKMCGSVAGIGSLELISRFVYFGQRIYRRYPFASTVGANDEGNFIYAGSRGATTFYKQNQMIWSSI